MKSATIILFAARKICALKHKIGMCNFRVNHQEIQKNPLYMFTSLWSVLLWLCVFGLGSCLDNEKISRSSEKDSFLRFAQNEIQFLQKNQPGGRKTVGLEEDVKTEVLDSIDWGNEIEATCKWTLTETKKKSIVETTVDSSGQLMIVRYNCVDTMAPLQELMVSYRKGLIDLMQWTVQQRSWWIDRNMRISFQPRKGFGISVKENSIWASPKSYEIYIEINNSDFLINRQ